MTIGILISQQRDKQRKTEDRQRKADGQTDIQNKNRHIDIATKRQTDRGRQTDKQTYRMTIGIIINIATKRNKQTEEVRQTDRQTK